MRVAVISAEAVPYSKTGGLGDVADVGGGRAADGAADRVPLAAGGSKSGGTLPHGAEGGPKLAVVVYVQAGNGHFGFAQSQRFW